MMTVLVSWQPMKVRVHASTHCVVAITLGSLHYSNFVLLQCPMLASCDTMCCYTCVVIIVVLLCCYVVVIIVLLLSSLFCFHCCVVVIIIVMLSCHVVVMMLGDSVDCSVLLDDHHLEMRSYSDNELLSSSRRHPMPHTSTQPNSETTSLAGELYSVGILVYYTAPSFCAQTFSQNPSYKTNS